MPDDERERLERPATAGHPVTIDRLLERHLPGLITYVRLHLSAPLAGREAPLDLVQSVCREVLQRADGFDYRGEGAFRNWLFQKALAKICDRRKYWQAQKRDLAREAQLVSHVLWAEQDSPSEIMIRGEDMDRLRTAFGELPPDYQRVVSLSYIVGLSRREIAEEMQRSEVAVRILLHRAMARLGVLMGDSGTFGSQP